MANLFLLRNLVNKHVLVSDTLPLQPDVLRQLGTKVKPRPVRKSKAIPRNPGIWNRIRLDHWVPFAIIQGNKPETINSIYKHLLSAPRPSDLGPYYETGEGRKFESWTPPPAMINKVTDLCNQLSLLKTEAEDDQVKILWERMDFRDIGDVVWPTFVSHEKLDITMIPNFREKVKDIKKPRNLAVHLNY